MPSARMHARTGPALRKVDSYQRMEAHIMSWVDGHISFLSIVGPPGMGKSYAYQSALKDQPYHLFKGRTTALYIYTTVCDLPDLPIVFDDVGAILRDQACLDLMKSLCDTRPSRVVQWNTNTPILNGRPQSFRTSSPVLLVCNRTLASNDDVCAIIDRADAILFAPPKKEVLDRLRTYANDMEILELLERLPVLPSLRTYEKAKGWKESPYLDLRRELLDECGVSDHLVKLVQIMREEPEGRWEHCYIERTGRSRRDYFNCKPIAAQLV